MIDRITKNAEILRDTERRYISDSNLTKRTRGIFEIAAANGIDVLIFCAFGY